MTRRTARTSLLAAVIVAVVPAAAKVLSREVKQIPLAAAAPTTASLVVDEHGDFALDTVVRRPAFEPQDPQQAEGLPRRHSARAGTTPQQQAPTGPPVVVPPVDTAPPGAAQDVAHETAPGLSTSELRTQSRKLELLEKQIIDGSLAVCCEKSGAHSRWLHELRQPQVGHWCRRTYFFDHCLDSMKQFAPKSREALPHCATCEACLKQGCPYWDQHQSTIDETLTDRARTLWASLHSGGTAARANQAFNEPATGPPGDTNSSRAEADFMASRARQYLRDLSDRETADKRRMAELRDDVDKIESGTVEVDPSAAGSASDDIRALLFFHPAATAGWGLLFGIFIATTGLAVYLLARRTFWKPKEGDDEAALLRQLDGLLEKLDPEVVGGSDDEFDALSGGDEDEEA